jgi:hypothetical protein
MEWQMSASLYQRGSSSAERLARHGVTWPIKGSTEVVLARTRRRGEDLARHRERIDLDPLRGPFHM